MSPKRADTIAKSVDFDQTVPDQSGSTVSVPIVEVIK